MYWQITFNPYLKSDCTESFVYFPSINVFLYFSTSWHSDMRELISSRKQKRLTRNQNLIQSVSVFHNTFDVYI